MQLRPYQTAAIAALRDRYRAGSRRVCVVAPCGAGKTVIAGALIAQNRAKGFRAMLVAHRWELLSQPLRLLRGMGLHCGLIKAGHEPDPAAPVQVASVQTLARRDCPPADLVIVDETHRATAATYQAVLEHYPTAAVLGLTASPWRTDGGGLGSIYTDLLEVARTAELVADGWLCPVRTFAPDVPELGRAKGADYTRKQISEAMDRGELIGNAVEHWERLAAGRPTVVFASSVRHSKHLCDRFLAAGHDAVHVDGTTPDDERERAWEHLIVCNVEIATEGIDVPRLSCASIQRPTASLTKHLQMGGRIMRMMEGKKDAILLDHAGNSWPRHGYLDEVREWSLDGREDRKRERSLRVCSFCFAVCPAGSTVCQNCGRPFPVMETPRKLKRERKGELRLQQAKERAERTPPAAKLAAWKAILKVCAIKGHKRGWAFVQYRVKFGEDPPRV